LIILAIYLTPFVPLSFKGEGDWVIKEGLTPLLNTPSQGYLVKGLKGTEVMIRRCSYHNSLPSPLQGELKRGEASLIRLFPTPL
jgi:hypothetical protein